MHPASPLATGSVAKSTPPPSRARWFVGGCVTGIASTLLVGCIIGGIIALARGHGTRVSSSLAVEEGPVDRKAAVKLAALVARPLQAQGTRETTPNNAEAIASVAVIAQEAERLAAMRNELSPIARDLHETISQAGKFLKEPPSLRPLGNAGLSTLKGRVNEDDRAVLLGLLDMGGEFMQLNAYVDQARALHTNMVALRLRAADQVARHSPPESTQALADAKFVETGYTPGVAQDALILTNTSGKTLTDVIVCTRLVGNGDSFTNCYQINTWPNGKTLTAFCRSEDPARETVSGVKSVEYRVFAAEQTGKVVNIKVR